MSVEAELEEPYQQLLEVLLRKEQLSESELNKVRRVQKASLGDSFPSLLIKLGLCSERDIATAFAEKTQLDIVDKPDYPPVSPFSDAISFRFLKQNHIVGLSHTETEIEIAVSDPKDQFIVDVLELACNAKININLGILSEIDAALDVQYGEDKTQMEKFSDDLDFNEADEDELEHLKDLANEAPVIKMVNLIVQKAIEMKASDIHIEPFEERLKVRLRVDGVLQYIESPPVSSASAVLSRIKIMAKLNIAERRLPQDGRIKIQMLGKELDLRVSTIPTMHGESVVIRLLDKENTVLDFSALGLTGKHAKQFIDVLARPHGIVLITGPTGSGKSTTLYTALTQLNTPENKIITVEDPVEYQLEGINQIQAKPQIGLTFSSALRSIVRQDPDVIMIGEMRDLETAKIAVQSALTGHLVLSTLHTNDAAGGITRLLDMGLEEYLLTSTVNGILAQRLVRKLCPSCKKSFEAPASIVEEMKLKTFLKSDQVFLYDAVGCDDCGNIGYKGRQAIIEFLPMSDTIRKQIMSHEDAGTIQKQAIQEGMVTMYEDGLMKAIDGITTLEEVMRVTTES